MNRTAPTATALVASLLTLGAASPASACSKVPVSIQRWSEATVLFIGRATADTLRAGPGDVSYGITQGHFGPAGDRIIHGQLIDVESLSSVDRTLLPLGVQRVVLVPWDYGADCSPTPWTRTARWITPGTRGIYHAELRKKSHWLNGVPVLDVYSPEYVPYIGSPKPGTRSYTGDKPLLGVDELYDAVEHLPDPAAVKVDLLGASAPFLEWARAHRSTIERPPLSELVRTTIYTLRARKAEELGELFAGTFRFVVSITGERDREFFMRTTAMSTQNWNMGRVEPANAPDDITRIMPVNGLEILTSLASTIPALPTTCFNREMKKEAWIEAALNQVTTSGGVRAWSGQIGWGVVNVALEKDPVLAEFKGAWDEARATRFGSAGPSPDSRIFFGDADGITTINDEYTLPNGRRITLRGERVSKQVQTCPRTL